MIKMESNSEQDKYSLAGLVESELSKIAHVPKGLLDKAVHVMEDAYSPLAAKTGEDIAHVYGYKGTQALTLLRKARLVETKWYKGEPLQIATFRAQRLLAERKNSRDTK